MRLNDPIAIELYESIKDLPIIDYHTHLPAEEILGDHKFENLWELWLKHDHYKWRLMRGCGVEERLITGCLLYTSPSPRDGLLSRMPSSA